MKRLRSFVGGVLTGVVLMFACSTMQSVWTLSLAAQGTGAQRGPIEGVWRVIEQRSGGRVSSQPTLGKGYHIYTHGGHYAAVRESGDKPRVQVDDLDKATAEQILQMWGPFVAQLGTYRISGDKVEHVSEVAKSPINAQPDRRTEGMRFKLEGDVLTMEAISTDGKNLRLKMVRVE
jgi:hypothetical protein